MKGKRNQPTKLAVAMAFSMFSVLACAQTTKQTETYQSEEVQSTVVFLTDGRVEVRDGRGEVVEGIPADKFFSCVENRCGGVDVRKILNIEPTVVSIQVSGSHYIIKKIGDRIYKIPLAH